VALAFALAVSAFDGFLSRLRGPVSAEQHARWMQSTALRALGGLGIHVQIEGQPPACGLVVSNHLSYLDIAILSAANPSIFVSKAEIGTWPFFGMLARMGGTIFLDRRSRVSAAAAASEIVARMRLGVPVLLFPEGTSTDGSTVLRFYTRLFQPSIDAGAPVTAAAIRYVLNDGLDEREMCWFGDAGFLPHLWKALGLSEFSAQVRFGEPRLYADRKTAAAKTRDEVVAMREERKGAVSARDTVPA
jgi:1-acyl-sn-glycerol-3-phosphate acyltransferase